MDGQHEGVWGWLARAARAGFDRAMGDWPLVLLCAVVLVTVVWTVRRWRGDRRVARSGARRFCAGPGLGWRARLRLVVWVPGWFVSGPRCGYELGDGVARCPECGAACGCGQRWVVDRRRVRPGAVLVVAAVVTGVVWGSPSLRRWKWVELTPTVALVATQRVMGASTPKAVRWQVEHRVYTAVVPASAQQMLIAALIEDLREDDVKWNASSAENMLLKVGPAAIPALEAALDSEDLQQRRSAVFLLSELEADEPSARLVRRCVEQMEDDDEMGNGRRATQKLASWRWETVEDVLVRTLDAGDWQQQKLAARLLAWHRVERVYPRVIPRLLEQVEERRGGVSGFGAVLALARTGKPGAQAAAERWASSPSRRLRDLAKWLVLDVERPHWQAVADPVAGLRALRMYGRDELHDDPQAGGWLLSDGYE